MPKSDARMHLADEKRSGASPPTTTSRRNTRSGSGSTPASSPQTKGIAERFRKTVLNEFYRVAFRKRIYASIEELQDDLDVWMREYNTQRPHAALGGRTPAEAYRGDMMDKLLRAFPTSPQAQQQQDRFKGILAA